MIRAAWYAALVLATLLVLFLLWQFSAGLVLFLLSLALAAAVRPLIDSLMRRGLRKEYALAITFGMVFTGLAIFLLVVTGPLIADLQKASNTALMNYERLKSRWQNEQDPLFTGLAEQFPGTQTLYDALTGERSSAFIQAIFGVAEGTLGFLIGLLIVVVLSLYWSADQVHFERLWLSLLPVKSRNEARKFWRDIELGVGVYLRREITLSVLAGVILWIVYLALGINFPTLLAMAGALARLIPWLGPVLALTFPLLAGSGSGWLLGITAAAMTFLVLIILEATVGTHIFTRQRYSSLLLVIIMIILADSYGLLGLALAPILAISLQILGNHLLVWHVTENNLKPIAAQSNLRERMVVIRRKMATLDGPHVSATKNIVTRLENLLEKALPDEQRDQDEERPRFSG